MNKKTYHTIKTPIPRSDLGNKRGWRFRVWEKIGQVLYFITWPGIWMVIKITPPRTRVIVEFDGKILLTKDWLGSGKWNLPGGGLHRNEKAPEGAARELYEETGIVIKPEDLKCLTMPAIDGVISANQLFFKTRLNTFQKVSLQKFEILDYVWTDVDTLKNLKILQASKDVVAALYKD